jgi:hypothetical protein
VTARAATARPVHADIPYVIMQVSDGIGLVGLPPPTVWGSEWLLAT